MKATRQEFIKTKIALHSEDKPFYANYDDEKGVITMYEDDEESFNAVCARVKSNRAADKKLAKTQASVKLKLKGLGFTDAEIKLIIK